MENNLILGIDIPEGAKVEITDRKVFIFINTEKSKRDLWLSSSSIWLVPGKTIKEFFDNMFKDAKRLTITKTNKIRLSKLG